MVKREVQHLDSEGCTTAYYAHWAAEPIPLGRRPGREDVKEGIIAYKIAVHAADIARIRAGIHDSRGRAFLSCYRIDLEEAVRALARTRNCRLPCTTRRFPSTGSRYVRTGVLFNAVTHRKAWPNIDWQPECTGFIGEGGYYEARFYVHGGHGSGLVVLCGTGPSPKQRQR